MAESDSAAPENKIRRLFQVTALRVGIGVFFFGLGVQSSLIHAVQMMHDPSGHLNFSLLIVDTALFFIGAACIMRGTRSLGKAMMLIAGLNPEWPET